MFRLKYLYVIDHPQLGDLELIFTEEHEINRSENPYNTVMIGPNGTGKSYILRTIIDAFRELYLLKKNGQRKLFVKSHFLLEYSINNVKYSFGNIFLKGEHPHRTIKENIQPGGRHWHQRKYIHFVHINGRAVNPAEIEIPEALLANSMMLTDKFVFLNKTDEFDIYKYLGIRASRSSAGTRSYIRNTINYLANSTSKDLVKLKLNNVLSFLELEQYLKLRYQPRRRNVFFTGNLSIEQFKDFVRLKEVEHKSKSDSTDKIISPWFSLKSFQTLAKNESKLTNLISFCNQKALELLKPDGSRQVYFEYDLMTNLQQIEEEISMINLLEDLNLLEPPELRFLKKGSSDYGFEGASSGESHFITSVIGILSNIKSNSLILIDEPEISLHPNWQMKYLHFLRSVFDNFGNCHFIIATHSHFLISDLKGDNSKIIGLKRENGEIETVDLPPNLNTFGWSAEEVLLKVFNAVTSRNYFVAEKLGLMLDFIAREDSNKESIKNKFYELELDHIDGLSDEDPLKMVFDTIVKEYVT